MRFRGVHVGAIVITIAATIAPVAPAAATSQCTAHLRIAKGERWTASEIRFGISASSGGGCSGRVNYNTGDPPSGYVRAIPGIDYAPVLEGRFSWPTKDSFIPVRVFPREPPGDPNDDPTVAYASWDKYFVMKLSAASNVALDNTSEFGMITSTPWCAPSTCDLSLSYPRNGLAPVTATYYTTEGSALAGEDFLPVRDGRLTIPGGVSDARIPLQILPNRPGEPAEQFELRASWWSGATMVTGHVTVTIKP
jgi:hypothetical protein